MTMPLQDVLGDVRALKDSAAALFRKLDMIDAKLEANIAARYTSVDCCTQTDENTPPADADAESDAGPVLNIVDPAEPSPTLHIQSNLHNIKEEQCSFHKIKEEQSSFHEEAQEGIQLVNGDLSQAEADNVLTASGPSELISASNNELVPLNIFQDLIQDPFDEELLQEEPSTSSFSSGLSSKQCRRFKCPLCAKRFPSNWHVQRHLSVHRPGSKPLPKQGSQCAICMKKFPSAWHLRRHMSVHLSAFACVKCGKTFKSQSSLDTHFIATGHGEDSGRAIEDVEVEAYHEGHQRIQEEEDLEDQTYMTGRPRIQEGDEDHQAYMTGGPRIQDEEQVMEEELEDYVKEEQVYDERFMEA